MRNFFGWMSTCFTGGLFGGLVSSILLWMAGAYGWTAAMGVNMAPAWTLAWLYPRLVVGGLWGLVFVPRWLSGSFFWRGLFASLGPSLVQLLILFPSQPETGLWGIELGTLTPVVVLVVNVVWGFGAAGWLRLSGDVRVFNSGYGRLH